MPKYKNIKTGAIAEMEESHYNQIKQQGFYEPVVVKKKAVKKAAKKKAAK